MRALPLLLLLLTAVVPAATASSDPLESWHTFELPFLNFGSRVTSIVHTQFRDRSQFSQIHLSRFGPIFRVRVSPRVNLIAGYWLTEQRQVEVNRWDNTHRSFAGAETFIPLGRGQFQGRGLFEHFFGGPRPPDYRTRWQGIYRRAVGRGLVAGLGTEAFTDHAGFLAHRLITSVLFPVHPRWVVEAGYMFDPRRVDAGGGRHILTTPLGLAETAC